jgi:hypothetical protein
VVLIPDSYRSLKKPYDSYFVYGKNFYALEFKVCRGLSLNFDMVKLHQKQALYDVEKSGVCGNGLIIIYVEYYNKNMALVITVYNWNKLTKMYPDITSIKIETVLKYHSDLVKIMERKRIENKLCWDVYNGIIKYKINDITV